MKLQVWHHVGWIDPSNEKELAKTVDAAKRLILAAAGFPRGMSAIWLWYLVSLVLTLYLVYQGFIPNLGKSSEMIIMSHYGPLLKRSIFLREVGAVCSSPKPNLSLSKSLIHTVSSAHSCSYLFTPNITKQSEDNLKMWCELKNDKSENYLSSYC